ncbi:MAG: hypothetical protein WCF57_20090 [Pyrinomonadaceae bacterium]
MPDHVVSLSTRLPMRYRKTIGSNTADRYKTMEVGDDAFQDTAYGQGAVVILKVGMISERGPHVIRTPDFGALLRCFDLNPDQTVTLYGTNPDYEPLAYRLDEIKIIGRMVGIIGPNEGESWVLCALDTRERLPGLALLKVPG